MQRKYQQCIRCVMDTTDPYISFNTKGYCNHCTQFIKIREKEKISRQYDERHLHKLVKQIKEKGKGREYDCLLGISGGVDSTYAAYILKKLGLRTLLVHMDNGWNAEEAVLNLKNTAVMLNMDYESFVLDWEEFRDLQVSFLKASVIEAETPTDIAIAGALHRMAKKYKIKYIISGGNNATEGILPRHWHYNSKDTTYLKGIHKKFGTRKLKNFPFFSYLEEIYYKFFRGIRMVYLLNYFSFSKDEAMSLLMKELKWRYYGGKHYESRYTKFIQSYLLPVKFNLDYRKATLSSQICDGKISREEALQIIAKPSYNPLEIEEDKEYVSKKLGLSKEELEQIIKLPPKTYKDYPNDEVKLEFIYKVYRRIFGSK